MIFLERYLGCQDGYLGFWDAIACADVRCKEECVVGEFVVKRED